jgi:hypothetical protein
MVLRKMELLFFSPPSRCLSDLAACPSCLRNEAVKEEGAMCNKIISGPEHGTYHTLAPRLVIKVFSCTTRYETSDKRKIRIFCSNVNRQLSRSQPAPVPHALKMYELGFRASKRLGTRQTITQHYAIGHNRRAT